ncbi:MAG: hypothetical protein ACXWWQ_03475 [Candidatus Limnocylindria bacterium]
MNPTMALMLSREFEEDRRRALAERRRTFLEPETVDRPARGERPSIWALLLHMPLHLPRFGPAR